MQDRICRIDETSCNARPDHTFGSKCEKLNVSNSAPLYPTKQTSKRRIATSPMGHCRKWLGAIDCRGDDEWEAVIDPYVAPVSTPIIGVQRVKRIAHVNDSICIRLVPQNHASAELELGTSVSSAPSRQLPNPNGPIVNQFTIAVEVIELILARHDRS
jgi:hypothetical protein